MIFRFLRSRLHVDEVVEQGPRAGRRRDGSLAQGLAVAADAPPVPLRFRLREAEVGEDIEDGGVDGLAFLSAAPRSGRGASLRPEGWPPGAEAMRGGCPSSVLALVITRPVSRAVAEGQGMIAPGRCPAPKSMIGLAFLALLAAPAAPAADVYFEQSTVVLEDGRPAGPGSRLRVSGIAPGRRMRLEPGNTVDGPALILRIDQGRGLPRRPRRQACRSWSTWSACAPRADGPLCWPETSWGRVRTRACAPRRSARARPSPATSAAASGSAARPPSSTLYVATDLPIRVSRLRGLPGVVRGDAIGWPASSRSCASCRGSRSETRSRVTVLGEVQEHALDRHAGQGRPRGTWAFEPAARLPPGPDTEEAP